MLRHFQAIVPLPKDELKQSSCITRFFRNSQQVSQHEPNTQDDHGDVAPSSLSFKSQSVSSLPGIGSSIWNYFRPKTATMKKSRSDSSCPDHARSRSSDSFVVADDVDEQLVVSEEEEAEQEYSELEARVLRCDEQSTCFHELWDNTSAFTNATTQSPHHGKDQEQECVTVHHASSSSALPTACATGTQNDLDVNGSSQTHSKCVETTGKSNPSIAMRLPVKRKIEVCDWNTPLPGKKYTSLIRRPNGVDVSVWNELPLDIQQELSKNSHLLPPLNSTAVKQQKITAAIL